MSGDPYIKENEELRAEIERLRAALEEIVNPDHEPPYRYSDAHEIARKALAKEGTVQWDDMLKIENERLRAALEEIVRNSDQGIHIPGPYDIAKEALAK